jgi:aryl-alcohol dehydrogenase-like predicted oxidoreductase
MNSQVILTFHRPHEVRRYETERTTQMLRTIAVPFIYWHQRCVRWSVESKIFAYQEPAIGRLFLPFQSVVAVDKLLARDRVHANISALRGNFAKQALHLAGDLSFSFIDIYRDSRPARIRQEIEDSLRRLRTDFIDLYQVHWPDLETPIWETARTLEDLRRQGKIRAIGVSNYSPAQMNAFGAVAKLDAIQPPYNIFEREIEADVLPHAERSGLTVLSYGALCRGLLSGRMTLDTKFDGDDLRKSDPKFRGKRFRQYLAAVDELKDLARARFGKSLLALAVRWVLDQGPTIALWGARHPGQLEPITEVDGWQIDAATRHEIDAILDRCIVDPVSPAFMAPPVSRPKEEEVLKA